MLAWAGAHEVHGRDALLAVILGYEAAARLGSAMRMRAGGHPHGTWGTVGAAVALWKLAGYMPR